MFPIYLYIVYFALEKDKTPTTELVVALNTFMIVPIYIIWHVIDIIMLMENAYPDGNGIETLNWWWVGDDKK